MLKKLLLSLSSFAVIFLNITLIISCGSELKWTPTHQNDSFANLWSQNQYNYQILTVDHWIDGDTLVANNSENAVINIRVEFIDTPESHTQINGSWVDTTGDEKKWADLAFDFGKTQLPEQSSFYFVTNNDSSYNRIVGTLFYGKDYAKNYSVEILKAGLALPFISDAAMVLDKTSIKSKLALPLADAYNSALQLKKGLYNENYEEFLKTHGVTDFSAVTYWVNQRPIGQPPSIYDYLKA